jgi:PHS family inorganic phosphate transporter-like MFS transporter
MTQQDHEDDAGITNAMAAPSIMEPYEVTQPPQASWSDIVDYFWHQGNYRTLVATSLSWLCLDLAFYGLGMVSNSSTTASSL